MPGTITISSSYGADGDPIGREIAQRLGVEFFDRAIPVTVARELAVDPEEALAKDWYAPGRMERVLMALASVSFPFESDAQREFYGDPDTFRQATESVLRKIADGEGGVIHGRASMVVLANRPDVLSVRLDGPVEARILQASRQNHIDEAIARRDQKETDDARESYVRTFYRQSQNNSHLYHVVLDSTALSRQACTEIVLQAAQDRLGLTPH
jgi:cytidylate kinase